MKKNIDLNQTIEYNNKVSSFKVKMVYLGKKMWCNCP